MKIKNFTTPLLTRFLTMFGMTKGNLFPNLTVLRSYALTLLRSYGLMVLCSYALTLFLFLSLAGCKKEEDKKSDGGAVTGVKITKPSNTTLEVGKTLKLTATVQPSNASNKKVNWDSDDESIATVSASGLVTAVGEGDTYIYASSDADYENCYDYIEISVTDNGGGGGGGGGGGSIDPNLIGWWYHGNVTGGMYDPITGHYVGTSGTGTVYNFKEDGTYFCLFRSTGSLVNIQNEDWGNYSAKNGILKHTNVTIVRSSNGGKTFSAPEKYKDYQFYYVIDNKGDMVTSSSYSNPLNDPNKTTYRRP